MRLRQQRQLGDFCEDLGPTSSCLIYDASFPSALDPIYHFIGNQTSSADPSSHHTRAGIQGRRGNPRRGPNIRGGHLAILPEALLVCTLRERMVLAPLAEQSSWYPGEHQ